jgi:hypothetical protein
VWFRFWFLSSAFGNLLWYIIGTVLSVSLLYAVKHVLRDHIPSVGAGAGFILRVATEENVRIMFSLSMLQLAFNFYIAMQYRFMIVRSLAIISSTCILEYRGIGQQLRVAMARRAVDLEYWIKHHKDIKSIYNKFENASRLYGSAGEASSRFEALRTEVNFVIQLYYNPLSIRLFVHSVFTTSMFMALKTGHNLNSDGFAALPATLIIGLSFAGILLFIRIADNPFFDDGSGPRLHAHTFSYLSSVGSESRTYSHPRKRSSDISMVPLSSALRQSRSTVEDTSSGDDDDGVDDRVRTLPPVRVRVPSGSFMQDGAVGNRLGNRRR